MFRSQLRAKRNNPRNNAANPRTREDRFLPRYPESQILPSARNRAATLPDNSARIMAAAPQYRRAWNRRRNTTARRTDFSVRTLFCEGEREVRTRRGWLWSLDWRAKDLEEEEEKGERRAKERERRKERRETRKEKGKREKEGGEERRKGRRE